MTLKLARFLLLTILAVLFLSASGCGGGDGDDAASGDQTAVTTSTGGDDTTESTQTEESETSALAGDCVELARLGASVDQAFGGAGPDDPEEQAKFFEEFADRTPEEIRDDFQLVAEAYTKIVDAMRDADLGSGQTPDPETLERLRQVTEEIDQDKLNKATANIDAWVKENCQQD